MATTPTKLHHNFIERVTTRMHKKNKRLTEADFNAIKSMQGYSKPGVLAEATGFGRSTVDRIFASDNFEGYVKLVQDMHKKYSVQKVAPITTKGDKTVQQLPLSNSAPALNMADLPMPTPTLTTITAKTVAQKLDDILAIVTELRDNNTKKRGWL